METALVSMLCCSPKVCSGVCMFEFSVKITCLRWNLSGIWGSQVLRLGGTTLPYKLGPGSSYKRSEMGPLRRGITRATIYKGYNSTYNWQGPFVGILKLPMFLWESRSYYTKLGISRCMFCSKRSKRFQSNGGKKMDGFTDCILYEGISNP